MTRGSVVNFGKGKIGLCTGGGDCPGLNTVIRTVTKYACGDLGLQVIGIRGGLSGLMLDPPATITLTGTTVEDIQSRGGTILGTSSRGSVFRDPKAASTAIQSVQKAWVDLGLEALIVVGGDGTQFMARRLHDAGFPVVGIPKTIDNDVVGIERSIGFASAVDVATEAAERLRTTAEAHDRVMVLEVMGRYSGQIALHTAVASGAHGALIPEIPFDYAVLEERLARRQKLGGSSYLIIVAEGAHPAHQDLVQKVSPTGTTLLGGIGEVVAREIYQRTGIDSRATVLGHLQRGGPPSTADRLLGALLGKKAVDLVAQKRFGQLVGWNRGGFVEIPYDSVGDARRRLDLSDPLVETAEAQGITLGRLSTYRDGL